MHYQSHAYQLLTTHLYDFQQGRAKPFFATNKDVSLCSIWSVIDGQTVVIDTAYHHALIILPVTASDISPYLKDMARFRSCKAGLHGPLMLNQRGVKRRCESSNEIPAPARAVDNRQRSKPQSSACIRKCRSNAQPQAGLEPGQAWASASNQVTTFSTTQA